MVVETPGKKMEDNETLMFRLYTHTHTYQIWGRGSLQTFISIVGFIYYIAKIISTEYHSAGR